MNFNKMIGLTLMVGMMSTAQARVEKDVPKKMENLLGHPAKVLNAYEIEKLKLTKGGAKFQPWSSSYWPDIMGGINDHYQLHWAPLSQGQFLMRYGVASGTVARDHQKVVDNMTSDPKTSWSDEDISRRLSPAEKYDLLLGDLNFKFTEAVMDEIDFRNDFGMGVVKKDGSPDGMVDASQGVGDMFEDDPQSPAYARVNNILYKYWNPTHGSTFLHGIQYWNGICDGWAPASIYLPRPTHAITVTGALGHHITFMPDDLKALGSYLFARTNTPFYGSMKYRYAGARCNDKGKKPDLNSDASNGAAIEGAVTNFECNDVDPGVFTLTLVNRLALDGMGFVMETDNNHKVDNHPVARYELKYFNPITGNEGSILQARVPIKNVKDGYNSRRNPKAVYLVGVAADVTYMNYLWAEKEHHHDTDSQDNDKTKVKNYVYDLELDADGNILGGEWGDRSREKNGKIKYADQPDFLWMASLDEMPESMFHHELFDGWKINASVNRPFGNMNWNWDCDPNIPGKCAPIPAEWVKKAKLDEVWAKPEVAEHVVKIPLKDAKGNPVMIPDDNGDLVPATKSEAYPLTARDSKLRSAETLSSIVLFLFDKARSPDQL